MPRLYRLLGTGLVVSLAWVSLAHAQGNRAVAQENRAAASANRPEALMERSLSVASENAKVAEALQRAQENPGVQRVGLVGVDAEVLRGDAVSLTLFRDVRADVVIENRRVIEGRGRGYPKELHTGYVKGVPGSDVLLFVRPDGSVSGRVGIAGKVYTIEPSALKDRSHVVTEHATEHLPPESEPIPVKAD